MIPPEAVGVALGSNQGNRHENIERAFAFLEALSTEGKMLRSAVVETEPVDCPPDSENFLNAVAEIHTRLSPFELIRRFQAFEQEAGRAAERARNAPRAIDLDLLYYGNLTLHTAELTIPHPRMKSRLFVLEPLAQIRPDLVLPLAVKTVAQLCDQLRGQNIPTGASR